MGGAFPELFVFVFVVFCVHVAPDKFQIILRREA